MWDIIGFDKKVNSVVVVVVIGDIIVQCGDGGHYINRGLQLFLSHCQNPRRP